MDNMEVHTSGINKTLIDTLPIPSYTFETDDLMKIIVFSTTSTDKQIKILLVEMSNDHIWPSSIDGIANIRHISNVLRESVSLSEVFVVMLKIVNTRRDVNSIHSSKRRGYFDAIML